MQATTSFPVYRSSLPVATASFKKDQPYLSDKHDLTEKNENGEHTFPDGTKILCRHLVMQFVIDVFSNVKGKVIAALYQGDEIAKHVKSFTQKLFFERLRFADHVKLIDNNKLGASLCTTFEKMEGSGETIGAAFLESPSHVMAIRFRIKEDERTKQKTYVATFYEPNLTGTWVRIAEKEATGLTAMMSLGTKNLLGRDADQYYFADSNTSVFMSIDQEKLNTALDRCLTGLPINSDKAHAGEIETDFTLDTLHPHHIYNLVKIDCFQNIKNIAKALSELKLNPAKLLQIVRGCGDEDLHYYALCKALIRDESHAMIDAYSELFKLLPSENRSALLIEITEEGISCALANDLVKNIEAYEKLLQAVPQDQRKQVLFAISLKTWGVTEKRSDGSINKSQRTGLHIALLKNKFDTISAYLKLIPENPCAVMDADCLKTLKSTLKNVIAAGDLKGISVCAELLKTLPEDKRADLLKGINIAKISIALKNNLKLAEAYAGLVALVPEAEREQFIEPLSQTDTAKYKLSGEHSDTLQVMTKLLKLMPQQTSEEVHLPEGSTWQNDLVSHFNAATAETKLWFMAMLLNVDPSLADEFIQLKDAAEITTEPEVVLPAGPELAAPIPPILEELPATIATTNP